MATDPGTAYTNAFNAAKKSQADERQGIMDMLSWKQMGEMRAQQMRLQNEDQAAQQWQRFYKEMGDFAQALKAVDPAQRELFMKSRMRTNGIDPNTPAAKDTLKFIKSADDATLNNLARGVSSVAANAPTPEAGKALVEGVLSGRITAADAEKQGQAWREQKARERDFAGQPTVSDALGLPGGMQTGRVAAKPDPRGMQAASKTAATLPTSPITAPVSTPAATDPVNAFAPQAKGGMSQGGMTPSGAGTTGAMMDPLTAANKAKGTVDAVMGPGFAAKGEAAQPATVGQVMAPPPSVNAGTEDTLARIRKRESGGRDDARAPTSSATGRYQYTSGTWLDSIKRYKPEWAEGRSDEELLTMRNDPNAQEDIMRKDLARHTALLENNGFDASPGNLYAMHHLGIAGAGRVLNADPNASLVDVLPKSFIRANPYMRDHTAGSLLRSFELEMGSGGPKPQAAPPDITAKKAGDLDQPTPVKTQTIDPATGQATTETPRVPKFDPYTGEPLAASAVQNSDTQVGTADSLSASDLRVGAQRRMIAGDKDTAKLAFDMSEAEQKRVDEINKKDLSSKATQSSASSNIETIEQGRDAVDRLRNNPYAKYITGFGARGIELGIPGTDVKISTDAADITAGVDQIASAVGGRKAVIADGIKQAQADLGFLKDSGVLREMAKAREGSPQGATGFGAMDRGERELLARVGSQGLDPSVGWDNFQKQLAALDRGLASRVDAIQSATQTTTGAKADVATQAARQNTEEVLAAARAELAGVKPTTTEGMMEAIGKALGLW